MLILFFVLFYYVAWDGGLVCNRGAAVTCAIVTRAKLFSSEVRTLCFWLCSRHRYRIVYPIVKVPAYSFFVKKFEN